MAREEWRGVVGYEGFYEVSDRGRVRRHADAGGAGLCIGGRVMAFSTLQSGYLTVGLCQYGQPRQYRVHRLVGKAFIENENEKPGINHKNGIKTDNRVSNLEWATPEENSIHAMENGLTARGERNTKAKLVESQVRAIRVARENGETAVSLSLRYGVMDACISKICKRKSWSHVE